MTDPTGQPAEAAPVLAPNTAPAGKSTMRDVLAITSTLIFVGAFAATFAVVLSGHALDAGAAQGLGQFQGTAITQWVGVMGWYFGSSRDSAAKSETIAAMAKGGQ